MTTFLLILFSFVINQASASLLQGRTHERLEVAERIKSLIGPISLSPDAFRSVLELSEFDTWNKNNSFQVFPTEKPEQGQQGYLVGGLLAPKGAYPYMVSVQKSYCHWCGGSIIHKNRILTAAHCVDSENPLQYNIEVGTNNIDQGTKYNVLQIMIHEKHGEMGEPFDDIALLKIRNIKFSKYVQPIKIYKEKVVGGETCIISGWGAVAPPYWGISEKLLHLMVKAKSTSYCDDYYEYPMSEQEMCTFSKKHEGTCHADSGGPLVIKRDNTFFQVGIVSRGTACAKGFPDVFTRALDYVQWIRDHCNNCITSPV